jgi:hypothetical protein
MAMKFFSDCSGPCETCRYFHLNVNCLAGHGDDHYVEFTPEDSTPKEKMKSQDMNVAETMNGYTEREIKLIEAFGYGHLVPIIESGPSLYRMCVEKAFIENLEGPHVEALRRAYRAISKCNPYRCTKEFEKLLEF